MVHGQYIRFAILLLVSIYPKLYSCYVNRSCSVQAAKTEGSHNVNLNQIVKPTGKKQYTGLKKRDCFWLPRILILIC